MKIPVVNVAISIMAHQTLPAKIALNMMTGLILTSAKMQGAQHIITAVAPVITPCTPATGIA